MLLNANFGAGYAYQWLSGGVNIPGAVGLSYSANATGNYTVMVTNPSGCSTTSAITGVVVNPLPSAITGVTTLCVSFTSTLTDPDPGGSWSSSNTAIATVSGLGVVTGVTGGAATITYTLVTGCYSTVPVLINPLPLSTAPVIEGGAPQLKVQ